MPTTEDSLLCSLYILDTPGGCGAVHKVSAGFITEHNEEKQPTVNT